MYIWIGVAIAIAIVLLIMLLIYKRQVQKICRQLAFINQHDTNMKLSEDCPVAELNTLSGEINRLLEQTTKMNHEVRKNEEIFKDTITNISHDIRTPLTSLDGYFQLLQQSNSQTDRERYIAIIQERIVSLNDMLEELFTYTKLQNDKYELALENVDFGKIVYNTMFAFYEDFQVKEIEPEIDFSEEKYMVLANKEAVRRVLQNIIKNAMEHGDTKLELKLYHTNHQVVFECSNDIKNVEEIDVAQIFTRFYKADSARTQSSTGLGLSIAKGLVEKMGGAIEANLEEKRFGIRIAFDICKNCGS